MKPALRRCDRCRRRYSRVPSPRAGVIHSVANREESASTFDEAKGDGYRGLCPTCADETDPHDMECGILTIDWKQRTFTVMGAGGHPNDVLRPHDVLKELRKRPKPGEQKVPFIVWQENADGYAQLCFHDRQSFAKEVQIAQD